ncbi:hypothetical protein Tco_0311457 [Tanacetum coccineum]
MIMKVVRSDDKMSQLLTQLQSQHEVGSGSESGEGGDDEDVGRMRMRMTMGMRIVRYIASFVARKPAC